MKVNNFQPDINQGMTKPLIDENDISSFNQKSSKKPDIKLNQDFNPKINEKIKKDSYFSEPASIKKEFGKTDQQCIKFESFVHSNQKDSKSSNFLKKFKI